MAGNPLGQSYEDGEAIVNQGEVGDCMYVIEAGEVEVVQRAGDAFVQLAVLGAGDFFGEMAVFDRDLRSATVRALGKVKVMTVDKATFLRRVSEDPTLAFRIVKKMSGRIRDLNNELTELKATPKIRPR
jgi:CRP-like cAMP-binding protein